MDPTTLMMLLQHMQSQGGQMPGQMPTPQQGQLPAMGDPQQQHHGGGLSPLMLLSPMGGLFASNPKLGMSLMSPAFGLANMFGAFK